MTQQELQDATALGETPSIEFKSARSRGDRSFPEVVRAVLGMANRRGGGTVVIGVENNGTIQGLTAAQVATWTRPDEVVDRERDAGTHYATKERRSKNARARFTCSSRAPGTRAE